MKVLWIMLVACGLGVSLDAADEPLDMFASDQAYWRSLWLQPGGHDGH